MTDQTLATLAQLQQRIFDINESKGFHDDRPKPMRPGSTLTGIAERNQRLANWQGNKLMLIVSEAVEAHDEIRQGRAADETYYPDPTLPSSLVAEVGVQKARELMAADQEGKLQKPEGVPSEIADIVIRCFDFAGTEGFDLGAIILEKLDYNETRPYKHGKNF